MYLVIAVFAVCALISSAFTVFAGRHCLHQRRMPSFFISFAATLLTLLLMMLAIFQDDLFHWRHWIDGGDKSFPLWVAVPLESLLMLPFTIIPSIIVVIVYRSRFSHKTMMPNKSPEPTAVGAGRSAVAVHAASRRWLSFFR
jgi:hypothetical protein